MADEPERPESRFVDLPVGMTELHDHDNAPTQRGSLEFDRFAYFSDAVFAIALTLLVVGIAVPTVRDTADASEMWDVLLGLRSEFVSFFVGFAVLGRYWLAHHRMVGFLQAVDQRLLTLNLVYLALIAFAPFPTALVGRYEQNIVAFAFYAVTLALLSFLETALVVAAVRHGLLRYRVTPAAYRHGLVASTIPVAVFLLSIPIALVTNSTIALLSWIVIWPLEVFVDRRWPESHELPQT
jgi:uncharacterized membrane protein